MRSRRWWTSAVAAARGVAIDARTAVMSVARTPAFALVSIVSIAVGVGLNVALFSVIDRLLFRPLPYDRPGELVQIHVTQFLVRHRDMSAALLPLEVTQALKDHATSFNGIGWAQGFVDATTPEPGSRPLELISLTFDALDILGVRPVLGRGLDRDPAEHPRDRIGVILTWRTWQERFGGHADALGRTWTDRGRQFEIAGVLPDDFVLPSSRLLERVDGVYAAAPKPAVAGEITIAPFARLAPGVSFDAAQAEVATMLRQHDWQHPLFRDSAHSGAVTANVTPLRNGLLIIVGPYLWIVAASGWVVLVLTCINAAMLASMRGLQRRRDMALRSALGASPARLFRLVWLESLTVSAVGALCAVAVCLLAQDLLRSVTPPILRGFAVSPVEIRGLLFALAAVAGTSLVAALVSAPRISRTAGARAALASNAPARHAGALLLASIAALSTAATVASAAVVPDVMSFVWRPVTFEARNLFVMTANHGADVDGVPDVDRARRLIRTIREMPGVADASAADRWLLDAQIGSEVWNRLGTAGKSHAVGPGFFRTLNMPLLAGREFTDDDLLDRTHAMVVSRSAARLFWPDLPPERAIGRVVDVDGAGWTVAGLVADTHKFDHGAPVPELFVPIGVAGNTPVQTGIELVVRMREGQHADTRLAATSLEREFPPNALRMRSIGDELDAATARPRFLASLFAMMAGVALAIVGGGVYAVAGSVVAARRKDIGIQRALGASHTRIVAFVARKVLVPMAIGGIAGMALSATGVGWLEQVVLEGNAASASIYVLASAATLAATMLAIWRPVRRAMGIAPQSVIRSDT